jgi:hypothetical protein
MEFCIISPTAGLERYARLSGWHLVLAHEYLREGNKSYREFYNGRKLQDDFIILDNGTYENGVPGDVITAADSLNPNVITLPDYLLQPWEKTWHAAIAFLDQWYDRFPNAEWCYIPQSEKGDLNGFIRSYHEAIEDPRITWIGIPRALAYAITDNPLARVAFARMVRQDRPDLKLHAFGMVNGNVHELGYLAQAGVTSIDSSAPVWRGWNGFDINDPGWDGRPVDFSARCFVHNHSELNTPCKEWVNDSLIMSNLEACNVDISAAR